MRYYLDFEFDDASLTPISMGLVSQNDRRLYLINAQWRNVISASPNKEWLEKNVAPVLYNERERRADGGTYHLDHWCDAIQSFVMQDTGTGNPEVWGYFSDYDWVLFCRLFGTMMDLPRHFPKYCLDLKQLALSLGIEKSLKELVPLEGEHNALMDARWMKRVHEQMIFQYGRVV